MSERQLRRSGLVVAIATALGVLIPLSLATAQAQATTTTTTTAPSAPVNPNPVPPFFTDYPAAPRPEGARLLAPSTAMAGSTITMSGDKCRWDGWNGPPVEASVAYGKPRARLTVSAALADAAGDWHVSLTFPADLRPDSYPLHAACYAPGGDGGFPYESTTITVTKPVNAPTPVKARPHFTG